MNHKITPVIPSRGRVGARASRNTRSLAACIAGEGLGGIMKATSCLLPACPQSVPDWSHSRLLGKEGITDPAWNSGDAPIGCLRLNELERSLLLCADDCSFGIEALPWTAASI